MMTSAPFCQLAAQHAPDLVIPFLKLYAIANDCEWNFGQGDEADAEVEQSILSKTMAYLKGKVSSTWRLTTTVIEQLVAGIVGSFTAILGCISDAFAGLLKRVVKIITDMIKEALGLDRLTSEQIQKVARRLFYVSIGLVILVLTISRFLSWLITKAVMALIFKCLGMLNTPEFPPDDDLTAEGALNPTTCVMLLLTGVFGTVSFGSQKVTELLTFAHKLFVGGTAVVSFCGLLFLLLPIGLRQALIYTFASADMITNMDYEEWNVRALALLRVSKVPQVLGSARYREVVNECLTQGAELSRRQLSTTDRQGFTNVYFQLMRVSILLKQFEESGVSRPMPFSLHVAGRPGVGKTMFVPTLIRDLTGHGADKIYHKGLGEYWNGLLAQKVFVLDEFLINKDQNEQSRVANEYLTLVSTGVFKPEMASVDNPAVGIKGTEAAPECVITINNTTYDIIQTIDNYAFWRRRHFVIEVDVARDAPLRPDQQPDLAQLTNAQLRNFAWLRFRLLPGIRPVATLQAPWMDYQTMMATLRESYDGHRRLAHVIMEELDGVQVDQRGPDQIIDDAMRDLHGIPNKPKNVVDYLTDLVGLAGEGSKSKRDKADFAVRHVGETHKAQNEIIRRLRQQTGLKFTAWDEESRLPVIVFANYSSRIGVDIDAALRGVMSTQVHLFVMVNQAEHVKQDVRDMEYLLDEDYKLQFSSLQWVQVWNDQIIQNDASAFALEWTPERKRTQQKKETQTRMDTNQMNDQERIQLVRETFYKDSFLEESIDIRNSCASEPVDSYRLAGLRPVSWLTKLFTGFVVGSMMAAVLSYLMGGRKNPECSFTGESKPASRQTRERGSRRTRNYQRGRDLLRGQGLDHRVKLVCNGVTGNGVSLGKGWFVTYYHWIAQFDPEESLDLDVIVGGKKWSINLHKVETRYSSEDDLLFFHMIGDRPNTRCIKNRFITEEQLRDLEGFSITMETATGQTSGRGRKRENRSYCFAGERYVLDEGIYAEILTHAGDCGNLYQISSGPLEGKFCAMHVAGTARKTGVVMGLGTIITRDLIERLTNQDVQGDLEADVDMEGEALNLKGDNILKIESVPEEERVHLATKTKFQRSAVANELIETHSFPDEHGPAVLDRRDMRGDGSDPVVKQIELVASATSPPVEQEEVVAIFETMFENYERNMEWPIGKRKLTFEEAIKGIPGVLSSIRIQSSPGYPLALKMRVRRGKRDWVWFDDEGELHYTQEFADDVEAFRAKMEAGEVPQHVWLGYLKDELRPNHKIEINATRVIFASNLIATVAFRMELGAILCAFNNASLTTEFSIGLNQYSHDMQVLYDQLSEVGDNFVAGDYAQFDKRHHEQFRDEAYNLLMKFARQIGVSENAIQFILEHERHSPAQLGQYRFWTRSNHMSGCFFTTILNCLVNVAYIRWAWSQEHPLLYFDDCVRMKVLGDDHLIAVADGLAFDGRVIQKQVERLGQVYTSDTKDPDPGPYRKFEEVTFLGAHPRLVNGQYSGALKKKTLMASPLWTRNKNKTLTTECRTMVELASQWDLDFYVRYKGAINQALQDVGCDMVEVPGYRELRRVVAGRTAASGVTFLAQGFDSDLVGEGDEQTVQNGVRTGFVRGLTTAHVNEFMEGSHKLNHDLGGKAVSEEAMDLRYTTDTFMYRTEFDWSTTDPAGLKVKYEAPFGLLKLGNVDNIQNMPFDRFIYWHGDVELMVQVNGSPMMQGLMKILWYPLNKKVPGIENVPAGHCVDITPNDCSTVFLRAPFVFYRTVMNTFTRNESEPELLGYFIFFIMSPLKNPTSTSCTVTIYSAFPDSKFTIPRPIAIQQDPLDEDLEMVGEGGPLIAPIRNLRQEFQVDEILDEEIHWVTDGLFGPDYPDQATDHVTVLIVGGPWWLGFVAVDNAYFDQVADHPQAHRVEGAHEMVCPYISHAFVQEFCEKLEEKGVHVHGGPEILAQCGFMAVRDEYNAMVVYVTALRRAYNRHGFPEAVRVYLDLVSDALDGDHEMVGEGNTTSTNSYNYSAHDVLGNMPIQTSAKVKDIGGAKVKTDVKAEVPMDNPPLASGGVPAMLQFPGMAKSNGVQTTTSMQLHPAAMYRQPKQVFQNETSVEFLTGRKCYHTTFNWSETQVEGSALVTVPLDSVFGRYGVSNCPVNMAVINQFMFWRADIEIELHAVRTQYHSGRLMVTVGYGAPRLSSAVRNVFYNQIADFNQDVSKFKFTIPYNAATEYLDTYSGGCVNPVQDKSMGFMGIYVQNRLKRTSVVVDNVDVLMFFRYKNVRVAVPRPYPFVALSSADNDVQGKTVLEGPGPVPPPEEELQGEGESPAVPVGSAEGDTGSPEGESQVTAQETKLPVDEMCKLTIGEKFEYTVTDIMDVVRRYHEVGVDMYSTKIRKVTKGSHNVELMNWQFPLIVGLPFEEVFAVWGGSLKVRIFVGGTAVGVPITVSFTPMNVLDYHKSIWIFNGLSKFQCNNPPGTFAKSVEFIDNKSEYVVDNDGRLCSSATEAMYVTGPQGYIDMLVPFQTIYPYQTTDANGVSVRMATVGMIAVTMPREFSGAYIQPRIFLAGGDDFAYGCFRPPADCFWLPPRDRRPNKDHAFAVNGYGLGNDWPHRP
jgi:hypothetical protein